MNINTPEFWDKNAEKEWQFIQTNKKQSDFLGNAFEYRWEGQKFGMIGWDISFKGKLLDIGCGIGNFCRYIKAKSPYMKVWGLDFSPKNIKYAKKLSRASGIKAKYIIGDATNLPFRENIFDFVIATEIIEHLDDADAFLQEIKRVLKPSGRAYITTPWKGLKIKEGLASKEHVQEWTPEEFGKLIQKHFGWGKIVLPSRFINRDTNKIEDLYWFMIILVK